MRKSITTLLVFAFTLALLSPQVAEAFVPPQIESMGIQQGWLVPNDYTTAMNPPDCKVRQPTSSEMSKLLEECNSFDPSTPCTGGVNNFVTLTKDCKTLGMLVRTLTNGKKAAYFPSNPSSSPSPKITPAPSPQPTPPCCKIIQTERIGFLSKFWSWIKSILGIK